MCTDKDPVGNEACTDQSQFCIHGVVYLCDSDEEWDLPCLSADDEDSRIAKAICSSAAFFEETAQRAFDVARCAELKHDQAIRSLRTKRSAERTQAFRQLAEAKGQGSARAAKRATTSTPAWAPLPIQAGWKPGDPLPPMPPKWKPGDPLPTWIPPMPAGWKPGDPLPPLPSGWQPDDPVSATRLGLGWWKAMAREGAADHYRPAPHAPACMSTPVTPAEHECDHDDDDDNDDEQDSAATPAHTDALECGGRAACQTRNAPLGGSPTAASLSTPDTSKIGTKPKKKRHLQRLPTPSAGAVLACWLDVAVQSKDSCTQKEAEEPERLALQDSVSSLSREASPSPSSLYPPSSSPGSSSSGEFSFPTAVAMDRELHSKEGSNDDTARSAASTPDTLAAGAFKPTGVWGRGPTFASIVAGQPAGTAVSTAKLSYLQALRTAQLVAC